MTLICEVDIRNGIEKWKNVTYRIEWFAEGTSLKSEPKCDGAPVGETNTEACPNGKLTSRLPGNLYKIGQSVSKINHVTYGSGFNLF